MEQMEQMEQSVQVLDYKDFVLFHDTEHCKNNTRVCPSIQSQQNRLCSVTEHNKRQSVTVTQCPKWLVRRLQPVPSKKIGTKKTQPRLGQITAIGITKYIY